MAHDGSHLYAVQPVTRLRIEQHIAVIQPEVGTTVARISLSEYAFLVNITQRQIESLPITTARSEEHTSELQSRQYVVCRLLLEKHKYIVCALLLEDINA